MRALSLWQPWASLVAHRLKLIETRGRRTHVRGRFAIHAAAKLYDLDAVHDLLARANVNQGFFGGKKLPLGAIVGFATLEDCAAVGELHPRLISMQFHESVFGNYSAGRFAWLLKDVVPLERPIPCRGRQGWFNLPPEIASELERLDRKETP